MNVQCNAQCSRARETSNAKSPSVNEMHKPLAEVLDAVTNGLPSPRVPREQLSNPHRDVTVALGEAHLKVRRDKVNSFVETERPKSELDGNSNVIFRLSARVDTKSLRGRTWGSRAQTAWGCRGR